MSLNIPDPGVVTMKSSAAEETTKRTWTELINESVHTTDDVYIGDIEAVSRDFIVVKRGVERITVY
ncbi:MAG: hypothetical protein ICV56_03460 [Nitrososphaeraceae archaeon]|nr:hypothetical protein [Nitrososphaeraceae archaeon]